MSGFPLKVHQSVLLPPPHVRSLPGLGIMGGAREDEWNPPERIYNVKYTYLTLYAFSQSHSFYNSIWTSTLSLHFFPATATPEAVEILEV